MSRKEVKLRCICRQEGNIDNIDGQRTMLLVRLTSI